MSELQDAEAAAAGGQTTGRSRNISTSGASTLRTSRLDTSENTTGERVELMSVTPSTSDSSDGSSTGKPNLQDPTLPQMCEPSTISSSGKVLHVHDQ